MRASGTLADKYVSRSGETRKVRGRSAADAAALADKYVSAGGEAVAVDRAAARAVVEARADRHAPAVGREDLEGSLDVATVCRFLVPGEVARRPSAAAAIEAFSRLAGITVAEAHELGKGAGRASPSMRGRTLSPRRRPTGTY